MNDSKTLVVGLGNPILGDDGVGWEVAKQLREVIQDSTVDIEYLAVGGLRLMEFMVGYQQAIVIDSLTSYTSPVGQVSVFDLEQMPDLTAGHTTSSHDTSLQSALEMGRRMGIELPERVTVVGIEAQNVYDFSEELTQPVRDAVPVAVERVVHLIEGDRRKSKHDLT